MKRSAGFIKLLFPMIGFLSGLLLTLLFLVLLPKIFPSREAEPEGLNGSTVIPYTFSTPEGRGRQFTPTPSSTQSALNILNYTAGDTVVVSYTEGQGLRLREYPSLVSQMLYLAEEDEVYTVVGGPSDADGYRWWYLESLNDSSIRGWGAEDYLERINE